MVVQSFRRPDGVKVTYRRMRFQFEAGFERYWLAGSPFKSLFWTQLSTAFEPGERFFIDSARALKDKLEEPALLSELAEFCRQEGHHTAQHLKFDHVNEAMGIDIASCRRRYKAILDGARANLTPIQMLAATCALEHFTSALADSYFKHPDLFGDADPNVEALWAWHAVEEAEHRATCFDIYRQLGGGYVDRAHAIVGAWTLILGCALVNTFDLLRKDRRLCTFDTLAGLNYLFGFRGIITRLIPTFVRYLHPGFHPWKDVDATYIKRWEAENRGYVDNVSAEDAA